MHDLIYFLNVSYEFSRRSKILEISELFRKSAENLRDFWQGRYDYNLGDFWLRNLFFSLGNYFLLRFFSLFDYIRDYFSGISIFGKIVS